MRFSPFGNLYILIQSGKDQIYYRLELKQHFQSTKDETSNIKDKFTPLG